MTAARLDPLPGWLQRPAARQVLAVLPGLRFVGGAVRNTLLGRLVGELDAATPMPPDEVVARLSAAHIRTIPTGLQHGTVTAVLVDETIEITTLRHDVETDGRHAVVAFTDDWAEDAQRRDFTMNALYLGGDGTLYDPVDGYQDCLAGRVRFVGDPDRRIAEDGLRLLRFYRMHALYGAGEADPAARAACRRRVTALARLSGERIRVELLKLLAAADPVPTMRLLVDDGIWAALFEGPANLARLAGLVPLDPDSLLRLASLLTPSDAIDAVERLKLSTRDQRRLELAVAEAPEIALDADAAAQRRTIYAIGPGTYRDRLLLAAAAAGRHDVGARLELVRDWPVPRLPIGGADVAALGVAPGPAVGAFLKAVETWWVAADFTPDRADCLAQLKRLVTPD